MSPAESRSCSSSSCEEWNLWLETAKASHIIKKDDLSLYSNIKYHGNNKFTAYFALKVASPPLTDILYEPHISLCYELAASLEDIGRIISRCESFLKCLDDREFVLNFMWWKKGWTMRVDRSCDLNLNVWVPLFREIHWDTMYSRSQMTVLSDPHMSYNPIGGWSSDDGTESA